MGIPIISLVGKIDSTISKNSDIVLDVSVDREACTLELAPTASTTASLAMGDALAITLLEKRNFNPNDFAKLHPAGSLGKKLLLTVDQIMHSGNELPIVKKTSNVDSGQIAVVLIDEQEATLKRVRKKGNTIALEAANRNCLLYTSPSPRDRG